MTYESETVIRSRIKPEVSYTVAKMSYSRRIELLRQVREYSRHKEFLEAGNTPVDRVDTALVEAEINRLYLRWGLRAVSGLQVDGAEATPEVLAESGPEELFQEALSAVRQQAGLNDEERKN